MKDPMIKVGAVISLGNGLILGALFSSLGMLKNGGIVPVGLIISILISMVISLIVGFLIPPKKVFDTVISLIHADPHKQRYLCAVIEGLVGDIIFTPILCTFFIIKNVGIQSPVFLRAWLSGLGTDFLIALPITMLSVPLLRKLAFRIFRIGPPGRPPQDNDSRE